LATDKLKHPLAQALKALLCLLSLLYCLGINAIYLFRKVGLLKANKAKCKVISVGNITLGGTGKTPAVIYILGILKEAGRKVAVLSRGYGAWQKMGDEPAALMENFQDVPVIVGKNRVDSSNKAQRHHESEVVLLDDGFQYWYLKKDLDVVAVDSLNPFGNERLIPRGILREPVASLKRADVILLTKTDLLDNSAHTLDDLKNTISQLNKDALIATSVHQPQGLLDLHSKLKISLDSLRGKSICAVSAIASPDYFLTLLKKAGAIIGENFSFLDHHIYTKKELNKILNACQTKKINTIVTTSKDAVKLSSLNKEMATGFEVKILTLKVKLKIEENEEKFKKLLLEI